jgi:hypothetical protein
MGIAGRQSSAERAWRKHTLRGGWAGVPGDLRPAERMGLAGSRPASSGSSGRGKRTRAGAAVPALLTTAVRQRRGALRPRVRIPLRPLGIETAVNLSSTISAHAAPMVHAILGVRAGRPKPAVWSPMVAWTIRRDSRRAKLLLRYCRWKASSSRGLPATRPDRRSLRASDHRHRPDGGSVPRTRTARPGDPLPRPDRRSLRASERAGCEAATRLLAATRPPTTATLPMPIRAPPNARAARRAPPTGARSGHLNGRAEGGRRAAIGDRSGHSTIATSRCGSAPRTRTANRRAQYAPHRQSLRVPSDRRH